MKNGNMKSAFQTISNFFPTRDFYLSCHLSGSGFEILEITREGKIATFIFNRTPALEEAVQEFYAPGPIRNFVHAIRDLKSRLYANP
jgi:hypothetical protein